MSTDQASQILDAVAEPAVATPDTNTQTEAPALARSEDKVSSKIDILIKREQQALARERFAKQKEQELEAKLKRIEEFESARENPDKALEMLGLTYDQLTQTKLNDGAIPPEVHVKKLEEKFDALKNAQEQAEQRRHEQAQKQAQDNEQKAISNFKSEINQYITDNIARYELINFDGEQETVFEVIDTYYNRTQKDHAKKLAENGEDISQAVGKVLSITEACDKVEAYLEGKYNKAKDMNKIKTLWSSIPKSTQEKIVKQEQRPTNKPQTLTNNLSASASAPRSPGIMSDEERVQKALAYARSLRS